MGQDRPHFVMVTKQPTGQDLRCLVCHKNDNIDIDHVVNRGMGGSKARDVPENKVPLCRECHELKTLGRIETRVEREEWDGGGGLVYWWKRNGADLWIDTPVEVSQRYKCLVGRLSDGAEEGAGDVRRGKPSSASSPNTGAEAGKQATGFDLPDALSDPSRVEPARNRGSSAPVLTHEQRVAIAAQIKDAEQGRQWFAGDTANAWRAELGEEAEQYLSDFGYVELSLANIMRVCEAIPPPSRNGALRFSHHVVVAQENREDMEMWLDRCVDEGWSVAEFRRQVKGGRPRVKRWTLEELRERYDSYAVGENRHGHGYIGCFLDWLGEVGRVLSSELVANIQVGRTQE